MQLISLDKNVLTHSLVILSLLSFKREIIHGLMARSTQLRNTRRKLGNMVVTLKTFLDESINRISIN